MRNPSYRHRPTGLLILLNVTLLWGCGSSDSGSSGEGEGSAGMVDIDPCSLVTSAEAADALEVATTEADRPAEANNEVRSPSYSGGEDTVVRLGTCRYSGSRGQALAVLTVMARQSSIPSEARTGFDGLRTAYAGTVTDVPGLGDQAFWIDGSGLHVLRGSVQLSISEDVDVAAARELAETALERLE